MNNFADCHLGLTDEQNEVLQEIVNIGMGMAGDSLARILKNFVELSIPRIRFVAVNDLNKEVAELIGDKALVTGVRQAFFSHWRGEAITIFDQFGCNELATLMGYSEDLDKNSEVELLLDVGNVLVGACLNGIAAQLNVEVNFSPPSVIAANIPVEKLFNTGKLTWSHTLLLEVNFGLENMRFKSHLMIMMSEETIFTLQSDLDAFLEGL